MSRFDYVKYDNASIVNQEEAKDLCAKLEFLIDNLCGEDDVSTAEVKATARSRALAITKLEECYMWIGKAIRDGQISRNGSAPLQESRTNS